MLTQSHSIEHCQALSNFYWSSRKTCCVVCQGRCSNGFVNWRFCLSCQLEILSFLSTGEVFLHSVQIKMVILQRLLCHQQFGSISIIIGACIVNRVNPLRELLRSWPCLIDNGETITSSADNLVTTPIWSATKGGVWCTQTVCHTRWWQTMNSNCYQKKTTMQILGLNFKPHSSTYQIHLQAFLEEENKLRKWKPRAKVSKLDVGSPSQSSIG
jgi:hypothetical protein